MVWISFWLGIQISHTRPVAIVLGLRVSRYRINVSQQTLTKRHSHNIRALAAVWYSMTGFDAVQDPVVEVKRTKTGSFQGMTTLSDIVAIGYVEYHRSVANVW